MRMKEITIHHPDGVRLLIVTISMINKKCQVFAQKKLGLLLSSLSSCHLVIKNIGNGG